MHKVLINFLLSLSILGVTSLAHAATFAETQESAIQGDAKAQYQLSMRYLMGDGVEEDIEQAMNWMRKAAEQGHANAQFSLGGLYHEGELVQPDSKKALYWYGKAIAQGHGKAMAYTGWMFMVGANAGLRESAQRAAYFYQQGIEINNPEAMYFFADLYASGALGAVDLIKQRQYYEQAAYLGLDIAQYSVFTTLYNQDEDKPSQQHSEDLYYWAQVYSHGDSSFLPYYQEDLNNLPLSADKKAQLNSQAKAFYEESQQRWKAYEASLLE